LFEREAGIIHEVLKGRSARPYRMERARLLPSSQAPFAVLLATASFDGAGCKRLSPWPLCMRKQALGGGKPRNVITWCGGVRVRYAAEEPPVPTAVRMGAEGEAKRPISRAGRCWPTPRVLNERSFRLINDSQPRRNRTLPVRREPPPGIGVLPTALRRHAGAFALAC